MGSPVVLTWKSLIVPAAGLTTPARSTLTASPALMASCRGIAAVPLVKKLPEATKFHPSVWSLTSTPETLVKFVGPATSLRSMSPPTVTASAARKPTV